MQISQLSPDQAQVLVPLNLQVQAVHSRVAPDLYVTDPDPDAVAAFLLDWLRDPAVTALIAGPAHAPIGYAVFEIINRPASALKHAECRVMLHHICVDAAHRRQGIASALIATMRDRAAQAGATRLWTSYAAFNNRSAALMSAEGLSPSVIFASGKTE